jgi:choline dehydrogenase
LIESAHAVGIPKNIDHNAADQEGVGYFQRAIHRGLRQSSARVFLRSAETRANVRVLKNSQAMQILFDAKRAVGIRYIQGGPHGQQRSVRARREVIITAGAINTPKLLQISGVGPAALLAKIGVAPVQILDGVGSNLRDHYAIRMVTRIKGIRTINQMAQGPALLLEIVRWALRRPSLLSVSPSMVHMFSRSSAALNRPDLEFACAPASFREGIVGLLDKQAGLTIGVWQSRPESLGYVRARSGSAFDSPEIQPHYLRDVRDQQALLGGMRLARKIAHAPPLDPYFDGDVAPAAALQTDEELLDFARRTGTTAYHMMGSCRMGPVEDRLSVVDHCLRVHGIEALRIADASIMPSMPSANTNASTLMIAEKAADLILTNGLKGHDETGLATDLLSDPVFAV